MKFFLAAVLFAGVAYAAAQADADQEREACYKTKFALHFEGNSLVQDIQNCLAESTGIDAINGKIENLAQLINDEEAAWNKIKEHEGNHASDLKCLEKVVEQAKQVKEKTVEIQNDIIAIGDQTVVDCVEPNSKRVVDEVDAILAC